MGSDLSPVAVVGAGTVGRSWSIVFARAGVETRLFDSEPGALRDLDAWLAARLTPDELAAVRARITRYDRIEVAVQGCGWVQESAPEDLGAKQALFAVLDGLAAPEAILASSTSTLPMTQIASLTRRPERCVVVHPTNPPHLVPLVEIVPGEATSPEVVGAAHRFMAALGQSPVVCRKEILGFVVNRLQHALVREALWLAREGVASVADIDRCVTEGLGLRWAFLGPFGVKATNAEGIADDLTKRREPLRALMADLCRPYDGLGDAEIADLAAGVDEMLAGVTQAGAVAYRDRMVAALRRLKDENPLRSVI